MDPDYEHRLLRQINTENDIFKLQNSRTPAGSPLSSPTKLGDRFIPTRAGANWNINFHRINENEKSPTVNKKTKDASSDNIKADGLAYSALLKNELLGAGIEKIQDPQTEDRRLQSSPPEKRSLFSYSLNTKSLSSEDGANVSPYSLSPVSNKSQKLLRSPRKPTRKISKIPFKVLDAPELQDDFYLNLVDWSALNMLSVGLGTCVYLWSACTSQVTRLCDLSVEGDSVTSVGWSERGNLVAVGTHKGYVQIWDAAAGKKLFALEGHTARVGALAWNADQLSSGSRDRMILQRDARTPPLQSERRLQGHRQEVCGLKWSTDHQLLASGGNDNKLLVWNHSSLSPMQTYIDHLAAVKAIAWSPHQHGLLASGGGTADRCIRFWNTLTSQPLQCMDTGSQVCNLAWSKHANELVRDPTCTVDVLSADLLPFVIVKTLIKNVGQQRCVKSRDGYCLGFIQYRCQTGTFETVPVLKRCLKNGKHKLCPKPSHVFFLQFWGIYGITLGWKQCLSNGKKTQTSHV
uniref:CDC20/Fizzy WD40 domain-containing protein n=1 Tax=Astatotilapia calliptera TaxID=8154 RepID=A0AAX7TJD0_ASTCA